MFCSDNRKQNEQSCTVYSENLDKSYHFTQVAGSGIFCNILKD